MSSAERALRLDERGERFDRMIERLLIGALAFMPLAFGAVEAWSEEIVIALAAALSICFLLKVILVEGTPVMRTWAYVPVAVFVLVAIMQLIPMPPGWIRLVSSNTVEQKTALLGDLPNADEALSVMTTSFHTWATRHDLRLVLAVVAVFVVVLNVYRRPDQVRRLLGAVAVIGAGVALLALLQNIAGNGRIYWFISTPRGTAHSGPFVNHSHYAQFINLSMGAALGLVFVKVHQRFMHRRVTPVVVAEYLGSPDARLLWAVAGMIVVGTASVFISLSRGGMVSMMIAGAFTTLVLSSRRSLRGPGWIMALLALGAFICVLYIGFDAVYDRLGTLRELHQAQGGRWQILRDVTAAWTKFPVVGTGLGTHEVVYPMFDRSTVAALASHAENEYAQTAEETGVVGLMALMVFGVFVWSSYARTIRAAHAPIRSAAYGLGFGLMAIMVHSLADFGQHVPANASLSAIFCALLIRLPRLGCDNDVPTGEVVLAGKRARYWGILGLAVVCTLWGWALLDADAARRGESHWRKVLTAEADLVETDWQGTDEEYIDLIRHSQKAANIQPGNITYRYWLPVYRWRAISRLTDPNSGEVILPPQGREFAEQIVAELNQARACCPTFGATWCVLGQLERFVLDRDEGAEHIRTGYALAPCDPTACLLAGWLDADEGKVEDAFGKLERAVRLDERFFSEAATLCIDHLRRPDLAVRIAGDHPGFAGRLAVMLDGHAELAEEVDRKLLALLEQKCREDNAPASWFATLASVYRRRQDTGTAIKCYRQALAADYGQVRWRLSLAELLGEQGLTTEAIHEAEVCLRLAPGLRAAERLIARLSVPQTTQKDGY